MVHSVGGWIALAVLLVVGNRTGRFRKDSLSKHIRERHSNGFILKKSDQIKTAITDNSSLINRSFSLSDISVQSKATEKVKFWLENNDFKVNPYDIECY